MVLILCYLALLLCFRPCDLKINVVVDLANKVVDVDTLLPCFAALF